MRMEAACQRRHTLMSVSEAAVSSVLQVSPEAELQVCHSQLARRLWRSDIPSKRSWQTKRRAALVSRPPSSSSFFYCLLLSRNLGSSSFSVLKLQSRMFEIISCCWSQLMATHTHTHTHTHTPALTEQVSNTSEEFLFYSIFSRWRLFSSLTHWGLVYTRQVTENNWVHLHKYCTKYKL